ncbi:lipase family protein [Variovorax sp. J22G21]|uniref:lipase family protein n=1 Tax=Variovorax fucosicus TaxID=3053517 RepID=UPI0025758328|nr:MULTISPECIES: lipase family protein [unclassified Variovorax]MDM0041232.1 lipase family protein [Variovorax sp. J22R193]MDM0057635.1 lipase family protein [Variovorax sp. J22G47]MDM0060289.1 lipase family protein [Variovorax sp. J22G21]
MQILHLSLVALATVMAGCAAMRPAGTLPAGPAAGDRVLSPFYAWTGALPSRPGAMLRMESQPPQPEITAASVQQRILYTSTDARWRSGVLPVTGTLYLPKGEQPRGGWPLVAWAHGTLGVADACAPSWTGHRPRDATYLNRWLEEGFAVVATDYQGLGGPGPHPYTFWEAEGRSILDSARAAIAAYPGRIANDLAITGQSQGSGSSIGASRIAAAYAPELNLRATIATGLLSSFPEARYKAPEAVPSPSGPVRFSMLRLVGGSIPDDGPPAESLVTPQAQSMLKMARETCVDEMRGYEQQQGLNAANAFKLEPAALQTLLVKTSDMSLVALPAPLFLGTGLADRTIPPRRQYAAAAALCQAGNPLVWKTYAGITHNGIVNAAFEDELRFVRAVRANAPTESNCGTMTEPGLPEPATAGIRFND